MEDSILVALSLQGVLQRNLGVVANNIANVNTSGFKAERVVVTDQQVQSPRPTIDVWETTAYVRDIASVRDPSDGRLEVTDNSLDLALRGEGMFVVTTPDGDRYTRDGHFRLNETGQIVTEEGYPLQGQGGTPLVIAAEDSSIDIGRDGTVSSGRGAIGKIRVVQFASPSALQPSGGGLVTTDALPQEVAAPEMIQGMIEKSNVEPISEIERMIRIQRTYDQAKLIVDREDERIRKVVNVFVE